MKLKDYGMTIIGSDKADVEETAEGHVGLIHDEAYTVKFSNTGDVNVAVELKIDGDSKGTWLLPAHGSLQIRRPAEIDAQFIFAKKGTTEFGDALLSVIQSADLGLVQAIFTPERQKPAALIEPLLKDLPDDLGFGLRGGGTRGLSFGPSPSFGMRSMLPDYPSLRSRESSAGDAGNSAASRGFGAGGTRFGGKTGDEFGTVRFDADPDPAKRVTISLRLVHDPVRVLKLDSQETPVPPPIGESAVGENLPRPADTRERPTPKPIVT